jgi:CheY-like chemotaxis protein/anti-sigma regulatory factor (Ser/Thr protein kinase)
VVRERATGQRLRLVADVPPDLGEAWLDERKLKQVLYNLLSNAIKFTEREKRIGIEARAMGDDCLITVWDQGIGIPPDELGRIFDPYTQARRARSGEGTGLGLAIAKRMAELHGGSIQVESEPGVGSRFTLRLPGLMAPIVREAPLPAAAAAAPAVGAEEPLDLAGTKALVVDDSPANRALMERILTAFGCTVHLAGSGEEALVLAEHVLFDLVFMDIQLPGMNGIEAMRRLRERGIRGPMVAITAYAMKGDAERFLAEGFDGYIAKPVRISEIVSFLEGEQ